MVGRVAQCTSTQLNPPLSFVRTLYWVLCRTLEYVPLMRIEKFVRSMKNVFSRTQFSSDYFSQDTKYTAIINTNYLIGGNVVVHDFRRLYFSPLSQNFVTFNRRRFSGTVEIRHYQPRKNINFLKISVLGRNLIWKKFRKFNFLQS